MAGTYCSVRFKTGQELDEALAAALCSCDDANRAEAARKAIEDMTVAAVELSEGEEPTVEKAEANGVVKLTFGLPPGPMGPVGPIGPPGEKGAPGEAPEGWEDRLTELESQMANLLYEEIEITSFAHDAGTKEMGDTVTQINLSWTYNKTPVALTLNDKAQEVNENSVGGGAILSGLSITKDKTWTLKATDERDFVASKTATVSFQNGIYYGAAAIPGTIDSAFVLGLTRKLSSGKVAAFSVNAADGEYIWYCLPKRMGTCVFVYGANEVSFDLAATIEFTNASGYTEEYYVYRNANAGLGSLTLGVK